MLRFLHLSDLHIKRKLTRNLGVVKRLGFCNKKYPSHNKIITGDVTDDGDFEQYSNAFYLLMHSPCYICPGNHDYGFAGNFYDRKRARRFDQYLRQSQKYAGRWNRPVVDVVTDKDGTEAVLVGLDSNIASRHPFDFACGKIGLWQRYWLKKILRHHADKVRIVYFHHHPFDRDLLTKMLDSPSLMNVLNGNCELVLCGHRHEDRLFSDCPGIPFVHAAGKFDESDMVLEISLWGRKEMELRLREVPVVE